MLITLALAVGQPTEVLDPATDLDTIMTWPQLFGLVVAPLMTYVVAYVTKASWPGKYKGALLMGLSLVNGVLVECVSQLESGFDLRTALLRAVLAFLTAQATYTAIIKKSASLAAAQNMGVVDDDGDDASPEHPN